MGVNDGDHSHSVNTVVKKALVPYYKFLGRCTSAWSKGGLNLKWSVLLYFPKLKKNIMFVSRGHNIPIVCIEKAFFSPFYDLYFTALSCGMAVLWLGVIDLYPVHPIPIKISAASSHLFMCCITFACSKQINMHRVFRSDFVHWKRCIVLELTIVLDLSILYVRKNEFCALHLKQ